jgi:hypothetical protein
MMTIKKALVVVLALAAMVFLFAGCSPAGDGSSAGSSSTASDVPDGSGDSSEADSDGEGRSDATESSTSGGTSSSGASETGELGKIMQDIIDNATSKLENIKDMTLVTTTITAENMQYYLGSTEVPMAEGIALEPEISSPFSVCLVRIPDGVDAAAVKATIKSTVDPQKWICMGVDPSKVLVEFVGDVVILIMTDNGGPEILEAFQASVG